MKTSFVVAVIAVLGLVGCDRLSPPAVAAAAPRPAPLTQAQMDAPVVAKAEHLAAYDLKDPGGAQFRAVFVQRQPIDATGWKTALTVCGEINAKNSYGAYVGFKRFIVDPASGQKALDPSVTGTTLPADLDGARRHIFEIEYDGLCVRGANGHVKVSASGTPSASRAPGSTAP